MWQHMTPTRKSFWPRNAFNIILNHSTKSIWVLSRSTCSKRHKQLALPKKHRVQCKNDTSSNESWPQQTLLLGQLHAFAEGCWVQPANGIVVLTKGQKQNDSSAPSWVSQGPPVLANNIPPLESQTKREGTTSCDKKSKNHWCGVEISHQTRSVS